MKITLSRNEIQAGLIFASTDESRYVLNGLLVEGKRLGKPTVVATDGRRLAVIETLADQNEEDDGEDRSIILRREILRALCQLSRAIGGKLCPWIEFTNKAGSKQVEVVFVGTKCVLNLEEGALIEGQYPAWRAVLPAKKAVREPINDLGLNADFIGDFASAARMLGAESPIVQMNLIGKDRAIEVRLAALPQFYGMVMPCKADDSVDYQPEFLAVTKHFPKPVEEEPESPKKGAKPAKEEPEK